MKPLLAGGIPNLGLDDLIIDVDAAGGEFHTDGGFGFKAEFISGKTRQEIGFSDARISNQDDLEQVIIIVICSISSHLIWLLLGFSSFSSSNIIAINFL